jgi:hypothetical protein
MPREMKVFRRSGFRSDCPEEEDRHGQTVEYVAARSKAEAGRIFVASGPRDRVSVKEISETGWPEATMRCLVKPGVVFWCGSSGSHRTNGPVWHEATAKGGV